MSTSVLAKYDRAAFIPLTEDGQGEPFDSKFGGAPYLPEGVKWPTCGICALPLQFVLQLDLDRLPAHQELLLDLGFFENFSNKVFQFFMCESYDCLCDDGFMPGKNATWLSVCSKSAPRTVNPPLAEPFKPRLIKGWEQHTDPIPVDELVWFASAADESSVDESQQQPYKSDKLLGWPAWVQESRHMNCQRCGSDMSYWFQIDSKKNVPYSFGTGRGHIMICPVDLHALFLLDSP